MFDYSIIKNKSKNLIDINLYVLNLLCILYMMCVEELDE